MENKTNSSTKKDRSEYWKSYYAKHKESTIKRANDYYWTNRKDILQKIKDKKTSNNQ